MINLCNLRNTIALFQSITRKEFRQNGDNEVCPICATLHARIGTQAEGS